MRLLITLVVFVFTLFLSIYAESIESITLDESINEIAVSGDTVWAATANGLIVVNRQTLQTTTLTSANSELPSSQINDIDVDKNGTVWCGTQAGLVKRTDTGWQTFTANDGYNTNEIFKVGVAWNSTDIWVTQSRIGAYSRFDGTDWALSFHSQLVASNSYDFHPVGVITADSLGNAWMVSEGRGLFKHIEDVGGLNYSSNSIPSWPSDETNDIEIDYRNHTLAATNNGLIIMKETTYLSFRTEVVPQFPHDTVNAVTFTLDTVLWIATHGGVGKFVQNGWTSFTVANSDLPHDSAHAIEADAEKFVWVASGGTNLSVIQTSSSPAIAEQPQAQVVDEGQAVSFGVKVTGSIPLTFQWRKNGLPIADANSSTFTITSASYEDNGAVYSCHITNGSGSTTTTDALLTVNELVIIAPSITTHPQSQTVEEASEAIFSVSASGTHPFVYKWYKNDVLIGSADEASYAIPSVSLDDNGAEYYVTVENPEGIATSTKATLTVNQIYFPPTIAVQPENQIVEEGSTVIFSVDVNGTGPISYQWRRNDIAILQATDSLYSFATTMQDSGVFFDVVISSTHGVDTSSQAQLTVTRQQLPPEITTHPQSAEVLVGDSVEFVVTATGTNLAFQWRKNGIAIPSANQNKLVIRNQTLEESGSVYDVVVSNILDSATSNSATVTVQPIPIGVQISVNPESQTSYDGDTVIFAVEASGDTPLTYTWHKNGIAIPLVTSPACTVFCAIEDSGAVFQAIVSNAFGTDTSTDAILQVNTLPEFAFTSHSSDLVLEPNEETKITWTTTGNVALVTLVYSLDKKNSWHLIQDSIPNSGEFDWTVPDSVADSCYIRIYALMESSAPLVYSDISFEISRPLRFFSQAVPQFTQVLGTNYNSRCRQVVTHVGLASPEHVSIQLFSVNGKEVQRFKTGTLSQGYHMLRLPSALVQGTYYACLQIGELNKILPIHILRK